MRTQEAPWLDEVPADGPEFDLDAFLVLVAGLEEQWAQEPPRVYDEPCECDCCTGGWSSAPSTGVSAGELPVFAAQVPVQLPSNGWATPGVWPEPVLEVLPSPSAPVQRLVDAVAGLAAVDPAAAEAWQGLADVEALLGAVSQARVQQLRWLADTTERRLPAQRQESVSLWRSQRFPDVLAPDATLAARLVRFPALAAALETGRVTIDAARRVASALTSLVPVLDRPDGLVDGQPGEPVISAVVGNTVELVVGCWGGVRADDPRVGQVREAVAAVHAQGGTQLARLEASFVILAEWVRPRALPDCLAQQKDALLPSVLDERAETAHQRRSLSIGTDGTITIRPDDDLHELLLTLLRAEAAGDEANPQDTSAWADRRRATEQALTEALDEQAAADALALLRKPRSRGQRLHDALLQLLQRYAGAGLAGSYDKQPVAVSVLARLEQLDQRPGALPARSSFGRSLSRKVLRRWFSDATVTALVFEQWTPIGVVHAGRTLTGTERKALHAQQGGCLGLDCCRPGDPLLYLTPHHLRMFSLFGRTSVEESILACPTLHHDLHHGMTVQLRDGRRINEHGECDPPALVPAFNRGDVTTWLDRTV